MNLSKKFNLKTPVFLLVFNRLDTTKKVFAEIRKARPKKLFIASDGPRKNKKGEKEIVEEIRKYILKRIDWKCEVKTLFRKKNLGCKYSTSGALDWFFENVEQGIILEDDDVPTQSFFKFCQELLERYKDDERVMSISGYNILKKANIKKSYLFSSYPFVWGFATWRRAWKKMDLELEGYDMNKREVILKKYYFGKIERLLVKKRLRDFINKKVNTWDISWGFSHKAHNSFCIVPQVNLIENIGFSDSFSTHTKENYWDKKFLEHEKKEISFPLIHPKEIRKNKNFDNIFIRRDLKRVILKRLFPF